MIKPYWQILKPGIILGNLIAVSGGFLLAAKGDIDFMLLFTTISGVALVIAASCVFNNYIDRDIDALMERTKQRPLVRGQISPNISLGYSALLGTMGLLLLYTKTNPLAAAMALVGFTVYVGLYSLWLKRRSIYGTLVGSLSGATPPVIGYCAVTNHFDSAAFILLLIFSLWQVPHSYAVALFRLKDYQTAKLPVLPVIKGITCTRKHIIAYILTFAIMALMLTLNGYTGYSYVIAVLLLSAGWLWLVIFGYTKENHIVWSKRQFVFSILTMTILSVMMSVDFVP